MLRSFTYGFVAIVLAGTVAACTSSTALINNGTGTGPNFATGTLYATNSTQNSVSIYGISPVNGASPQYQIGGTSTSLNGPDYLAFDGLNNLWVTNYNAASGASQITIIKALATGNVSPLQGFSSVGHVRGLAYSTKNALMAVATTISGGNGSSDQVLFFSNSGGLTLASQPLAGSNTGLNQPSGVAFDASNNMYVTNQGNASVEKFVVPTPTPTPVPTATPTASPTPSPTPSPTATPPGATATPSPTPVPTPVFNVAPMATIIGAATGLVSPAAIAVDSTGLLYVADPGSSSIRVFAAGASGNVAPIAVIAGPLTQLQTPTDIKIDPSGNVYVADAGANKILVFSPLNGATGAQNIAPKSTLAVVGNVIGLGFSP